MNAKKMSLGSKLIVGFLAVISVSTIGSIVTMINVTTLEKDLTLLVNNSGQLQRMQDVQYGVVSIVLAIEIWRDTLTPPREFEEQFKVIAELRERNNQCLSAYDELFNDPNYEKEDMETTHYNEVQEALRIFREKSDKVIDLAQKAHAAGQMDAAQAISRLCTELDLPSSRAALATAVEALRDLLARESASAADQSQATAATLIVTSLAVTIIVLVLGLSVGIILSRSITSVTQSISKALLTNSEYVSSSSKELAAGSQALAAGSSQQAASVEQISASLEEISSMVKQNADNATQAKRLTETAGDAVDATSKSMQRSLEASEAIAKASNETSKIIKTIDEIAFQTNLLSLNAAVEAARAGEAGAGFAVVADEVRGLSMRSAEASKRTAELIEQTIEKVREGIDIFNETGKSIDDVVHQTHKIQQLIEEIAAASDEQSKGIEQINRGVSEMEKVIQQNAANSEESAASTEELYGQATEMTDNVYTLEEYIFGTRRDHTEEQPSPRARSAAPKPREFKSELAKKSAAPARPALQKPALQRPSISDKAEPARFQHAKKEASAKTDQVIPLDDDDTKDF